MNYSYKLLCAILRLTESIYSMAKSSANKYKAFEKNSESNIYLQINFMFGFEVIINLDLIFQISKNTRLF